MTFASRITRTPDAFDPACGADVSAEFSQLTPNVVEVVSGAAGCSPYLSELLRLEGTWITGALDDPEKAVADLLAEIPEIPLDALPVELRRCKRRIALLVGLADLGGVWPLETVTQVLTDFADAAVQATIVALVAAEVSRGKLPQADDPANAGGMVVLAMGKMGAGELNYSSDIDLICLFDETRFDPDDYHMCVRRSFV